RSSWTDVLNCGEQGRQCSMSPERKRRLSLARPRRSSPAFVLCRPVGDKGRTPLRGRVTLGLTAVALLLALGLAWALRVGATDPGARAAVDRLGRTMRAMTRRGPAIADARIAWGPPAPIESPAAAAGSQQGGSPVAAPPGDPPVKAPESPPLPEPE